MKISKYFVPINTVSYERGTPVQEYLNHKKAHPALGSPWGHAREEPRTPPETTSFWMRRTHHFEGCGVRTLNDSGPQIRCERTLEY